MVENTTQLIHKILDGDDDAFSSLIEKYQKGIHALAWRKIGDYHIAQEITQDVFLQVYEKLSTLRNPEQFDGWIYVITNRLCINWLQRHKPKAQPLSNTPQIEIEKAFFRYYETEHRQTESNEHYREVVQLLLEKLPESERTVITLYYMGEMTPTQISKFLGVSVNTIKSRLRRAQDRLQSEVKNIIDELFGDLRFSSDLTENIMRKIEDMKPEPVVAKPWIPVTAFFVTVGIVVLLFGVMNQQISFFQQPYNLDAVSETAIEIVESPIRIDILPKTIERKRMGRITSKNNIGTGSNLSNTVIDSNTSENTFKLTGVSWTSLNETFTDGVNSLFFTTDEELFTITGTGVYKIRLTDNTWTKITANRPFSLLDTKIIEHQGIVYLFDNEALYSSIDQCKTWHKYSTLPKGRDIGLIIQDKQRGKFVMYLAKQNGVYQSVNAGKRWIPISKGLKGKKITSMTELEGIIFVGTSEGVYRWDSSYWLQLSVEPNRVVHSLATSENNLYVVTGPPIRDFFPSEKSNSVRERYRIIDKRQKSAKSIDRTRKIYHSANFGNSWSNITPKDEYMMKMFSSLDITKISANGNTLFVYEGHSIWSTDKGKTWTVPKNSPYPRIYARDSLLELDNKTYVLGGLSGLFRSNDGGITWHKFMNGILGSEPLEWIVFNNKLYVYTGTKITETDSHGRIWKAAQLYYPDPGKSDFNFVPDYVQGLSGVKFIVANNYLYMMIYNSPELRILRSRKSDRTFIVLANLYLDELSTGNDVPLIYGNGAVGDDVYYIEYNRRIFKWEYHSAEYIDTGLMDISKDGNDSKEPSFKLAASPKEAYAGRRDGRLFKLVGSGNSWIDITKYFPISYSYFNDITIVGNTVYVSTDIGVFASQTGKHWRIITDNVGEVPIIDKFATNSSRIYGASETGIYLLDHRGRWENIYPELPGRVVNISVSQNTLYIGTEEQEIFHVPL